MSDKYKRYTREDLEDAIDRLRAKNAKLRSALVVAKDLLGFWSSYAPYYSKEKHGLSDDLAYIAAALKETGDE